MSLRIYENSKEKGSTSLLSLLVHAGVMPGNSGDKEFAEIEKYRAISASAPWGTDDQQNPKVRPSQCEGTSSFSAAAETPRRTP